MGFVVRGDTSPAHPSQCDHLTGFYPFSALRLDHLIECREKFRSDMMKGWHQLALRANESSE